MIRIRVIDKLYSTNNMLVGYTIQNEDNPNEKKNIYKNDLKNAIQNGQCECVNMTLTSDGRLMGQAKPKPRVERQTPQVQNKGHILVEVYTNGRRLVGGLVNDQPFMMSRGITPPSYTGIDAYFNFECGYNLNNRIQTEWYDNIKNINGTPDMTSVKRKSFSKIKGKLLNMLKNNGVSFKLEVEKQSEKYEYAITIQNYEKLQSMDTMLNAIYCLIDDACATAKIKVVNVDKNKVYVKNLTGIKDVRQALKGLYA